MHDLRLFPPQDRLAAALSSFRVGVDRSELVDSPQSSPACCLGALSPEVEGDLGPCGLGQPKHPDISANRGQMRLE